MRTQDMHADALYHSHSPRLYRLDCVTAVKDRVLDRNPAEEIAKAFQLFDGDKSGTVSINDLRRVAR